MSKFLILPGNQAIRQNPVDPVNGFPTFDHQELVPGAKEALDFYKQEGFKIVVCENAGAIESGISSLQEKMSEFIVLMTQIAPQIDELIFCPDYKGAYAYNLSKPAPNQFPQMRRLKATGIFTNKRPPGDEEAWFEDVALRSFRKPGSGMLDFALLTHKPSYLVAVWERSEDKEAIASLAYAPPTQYIQSAKFWRDSLNPTGSDLQPSAPVQTAQSVQPTSKARRFEYRDLAQNSNKFWEITMLSDGLSFDLNYGRIGTRGRTNPVRKTFTSTTAAMRDYQKRISEQLRDGYVEV